jgi:parallel beta-helix repeat protein
MPTPSQVYVRPEDYPRYPGENDDRLSLLRTIAGAKNLNATVWLEGAYTIGGPLDILDGVHVMGQGPAVTSISATSGFAANEYMLRPGNGVTVEGITLDASLAATNVTHVLSMDSVSGVAIRNCVLTGASRADAGQITIEDCANVVVADCEVSDGTRGIAVIEACADVRITGCRVHHITEGGIYVSAQTTASVRTVVEGCRLWSITGGQNNYPIYFGTAQPAPDPTSYHVDARVIGNHVEGNPGKAANPESGTWTGGTSDNIAIYECRGAVISDNHSTNGGDLGISVDYSDRCIVVGNVCALNTNDGIAVVRSTNCVVSANVSLNNGRDWAGVTRLGRTDLSGIRVETSHQTIVTGNRCYEEQDPATPAPPQVTPGRQQYGISVTADSTGTLIGSNDLQGKHVAPYIIWSAQAISGQWDGTASRFSGAVRVYSGIEQNPRAVLATDGVHLGAGGAAAPDASISRLGVGITRVSGYLCAGDNAVGWGASVNAKANSDASLGAVIRGNSAGQSADLLAVQSHDGAQTYLRVGLGVTVARSATTTQPTDVVFAAQSHDGAQSYLRVIPGLTAARPASSSQTSDVFAVESHDGTQSYLRVAPGKLGFFGHTPEQQPSVSTTGTADDKVDGVITALRSRGLIAP